MDIKEEKADFEAEFRKTDFYKMNLVNCFCFINDRYVWDEVQAAWEMWQAAKAQAVPEGFVLVSKEIPDSVVDRLRYSSYHWGDGTRDYFTPVYQMIIEAQEQK